ncbi:hypothetical protein CEN39_28300 [Fischerella thermalis CCMEE 5201]|nr:hypothetical protein CEN39_28300 [Fischerella thermalis CCMEE 5201]
MLQRGEPPQRSGSFMPGNPFGSRSWGTRGPHSVGIGGEPPRPRCLTTALAPPLGERGPEFPSPYQGEGCQRRGEVISIECNSV